MCCEECTTNTPLLWYSCSKVSHLKGTADVCASSTSSFMKLSGDSFCLLQFPLLLPAFQFQASTAASLGSSLGLLSVTYTILELVATTTTTLLCNLFIKSKSPAVSSNRSSAYTRLLHSIGAIIRPHSQACLLSVPVAAVTWTKVLLRQQVPKATKSP